MRTLIHQPEYEAFLDGLPNDHRIDAARRGLEALIATNPDAFPKIPQSGGRRLAKAGGDLLRDGTLRVWFSIRDGDTIYLWAVDYAEEM